MSPEHLEQFARAGFNRVPVVREVLADLDTPLSAYRKLAAAPYSFLFESVQGGERWGRYSIIGLPAREVIRVYGNEIRVSGEAGEQRETVNDPIAWIDAYRLRYRAPDIEGLPRFNGGLVGYFGYDSVRYFEPRLGQPKGRDTLGNPDILLMRSEEVVVFDNLRGSLFLVVLVDPAAAGALAAANARLDVLQAKLRAPLPAPEDRPYGDAINEADFASD